MPMNTFKKMFNLQSLSKNTIVQCGVAALISVGLLSGLHIRPLATVFLVLFCFWCYKTRCSLRIVAPPELQKHYERLVERLSEWRRTEPTIFCVVTSSCLGALAIVGHLVSGSIVVLAGLVLAALASTKYNFKLIKLAPQDFAWSETLVHDLEVDDEFVPEVDETNLFVLERAGDLASITLPTEGGDVGEEEEKSDEVPSELLLADPIPEIDENSTDDDEDDLMPVVQPTMIESQATSSTQASNEQSGDVIEFKKSHFKRDSSLSTTSSSSEESLSKGLQFPDHTAVDGAATSSRQLTAPPSTTAYNQEASNLVALAVKTQAQAVLANSGKLLPNLVSGIVQWSMGGGGATAATAASGAPVQLDSSDESDFEILENEDLK